MQSKEILEWLNTDTDFYTTKILKQHWKESKYSYRTAPRPDFGMLLVMKGSIDFITDGEVLTARAGNLVFLPKHSRYEAVFTDEVDDLLVSFDTKGKELLMDAPIVLSERTPLSCVERFRALVEGHFYKELTWLQKKGLFYLLLDAVITDAEAQANEHRHLIDQAKALLQDASEPSIGEIAKRCAVSESGLRQIFKEQTGLTPTQYRTDIKLKKAIYLLESTDLTVSEITEHLHFFDAAYFCKVFRSRVGITPKQYVKNKKI